MNAATSINYVWWVAAGGATGATVHYLAVTLLAPRVGRRFITVALAMIACLLLGAVVASSGRHGAGYAGVGIGFLGALAPFTAVAEQVLDAGNGRPHRHTLVIAAGTVLAGVAMAILGYIGADMGTILFEKIPARLR